LSGENHHDLRLNLLALEESYADFRARSRYARCFRRSARDLSVRAAFAFLINVGRKISGLAQLTDRFIAGARFNQPGRFLSAGIESYVGVTRHELVSDLASERFSDFSDSV
jgi:hypothetical protein